MLFDEQDVTFAVTGMGEGGDELGADDGDQLRRNISLEMRR